MALVSVHASEHCSPHVLVVHWNWTWVLIAITDYGGGKNPLGINTPISVVPLWVMSFYDIVVFSCLFFASAYGYLHGMCEFAGFSGEQWAFFLLCNEPLNILEVPNVTYPWQTSSRKKKVG